MENLTATESAGLLGLLTILATQYGPAILAIGRRIFSQNKEISDAQCTAACNTIWHRLSKNTRTAVWTDLEPGRTVEGDQ